MKNCQVLVGPIIDGKGAICKNGSSILLEDGLADTFAKWRFVKIVSVVPVAAA